MNQDLLISGLQFVIDACGIAIDLLAVGLLVAVAIAPREGDGFWGWHPVKRFLAVVFLPMACCSILFFWPMALIIWLARRRSHDCHVCQGEDDFSTWD